MVPVIKIENDRGEVLDFSTSSRYVAMLTGTGPPAATINRAKVSVSDGTRFNSATVNERELLLTIHILRDVARARLNLYRFIATKTHVKIYYQADGLDVYIEGYVETAEVNPWEENQNVQVSIICPMPFWQDVANTYTNASQVMKLFELPFYTDGNSISTAHGYPISINNSVEAPLDRLTIYGKTIQNGIPTPDAPVALESVGDGGSFTAVVSGANLIGEHNLHYSLANEGTYSVNGDVITASSKSSYGQIEFRNIPAVPGATLYLSCKGITGGNNAYIKCAKTTAKSTTAINFSDPLSAAGKIAVTVPDDAITVGVRMYINGTSSPLDKLVEASFDSVMLSYMDADYEPGKGMQTLPVSTPSGLPGIRVDSGGNYTDSTGQQWICDEIDFERGLYVQRVQKVVLDGNKTYGYFPSATAPLGGAVSWKIEDAPRVNVKNYAISDRAVNNNNTAANMYHGTFSITTTGVYIFVPVEGIIEDNCAIEAPQWFTKHPTTVIYALAEEKNIPLSKIDPDVLTQYATLHTNYPNTTVLNDGGADMEAVYYTNYSENGGIELSTLNTGTSTLINNSGTVEAGATFVITATVLSQNPRIHNLSTGEFIGVHATLQAGDQLEICTVTGSKRITHIRNGVRTNYINTLMMGSRWLQMVVGENEYSYTVDTGECELGIYHTNMYTGV